MAKKFAGGVLSVFGCIVQKILGEVNPSIFFGFVKKSFKNTLPTTKIENLGVFEVDGFFYIGEDEFFVEKMTFLADLFFIPRVYFLPGGVSVCDSSWSGFWSHECILLL